MSTNDLAEQYRQAWREAIVDGAISPFEQLLDHDFVSHSIGMKDIGFEARRQHVVDMHDHSQVLNVDIKLLTSDQNLFALEFNGHFRFITDMPGLPGTAGKEVKSRALCLYRVKNGKIAEEWANTTVSGLT